MTRNGLFFTPLFLCLGAYLYLERQKERRGVKELSLFFMITLAMMLVESIFLHRLFVVRHDSMYLLLPVVMYFLYLLLLNWQPKLRIKQVQNLSLLIYIIHPVVIVVVHTISNKLTFMKFSLLYYLLVVAGSYILSRLLLSIFKQNDKIKEASYRAEREISTNAVKHNIKEIKKMIPQKTEIIAVVKANAYGADLVEYAKILEKNQVTFFAVATIDEGIKLRKAMIKGDILVLGLTDPLRAKELIKYDLIQSIVSEEYGRMLNHKKLNIRCHVEVDTGMHRLGVEADIDVITRLYQLSFLRIEGIYSHLGSSDSLDSVSKIRTEKQLSVYCHLLNELKERRINYGVTHIQSSYGILNYSEYEFDYVRAGIMLYGFLSSDEPTARQISLKPVMKIKAKLISKRWVKAGEILGYGNQTVLEKERLIGVISIGYADGLPRSLSYSGFKVEYQDYLLPQVGKVCMDMMLIDLTQVEKIQLNEEVTVMSDFTEIALLDDTITNETMSQLGNRLTTTVTY
jgi:serine/alanine racemase